MELHTFSPRPFRPALFWRNPHVQSVLPTLIPKPKRFSYEWEEVSLPDGVFIDIAHIEPSGDGPLVVLLHGLEGSIHSPYITQTINHLVEDGGWQVSVMHFRTCSGRLNRTPLVYHGGLNADFQYYIEQLRHKYPERPIYAIGFSIGACVLTHYLARVAKPCIDAGVAISMPFQLGAAVDSTPKFYLSRLVKSLKAKTKKSLEAGIEFPFDYEPIDPARLAGIKTLREFDTEVTAPMFDFITVDAYYEQESVRQYLCKVASPLLILHALDDPFIPIHTVPAKSELSDKVKLYYTDHGGHTGFLYGYCPWRPRNWAVETACEFLRLNI